jgi:hypothetical protein
MPRFGGMNRGRRDRFGDDALEPTSLATSY